MGAVDFDAPGREIQVEVDMIDLAVVIPVVIRAEQQGVAPGERIQVCG